LLLAAINLEKGAYRMKIKDLSKKFLRVVFVTLIIGFLSFVSTSEAQAANFTVNNNGDTSDVAAGNGICADAGSNCTLRAAIEEANALSGNDTIDFAASLTNATITLTTGVEILISGTNGTLQINGLGADKLTIDGGTGSNRIFFTDNGATVTITGVTMQGGNGGSGGQGGAIYANGGSLSLVAVLVQNNIVGDRGGGIYFNGGANHHILNSTIFNNSASAVGGGIFLNGGTLFVANTTVSGNHATGNGSQAGGVLVGGTATFRNSTITNNTAASAAGGIQAGTVNLGNTIVAGNSAPNFPEILNFGGTSSAGNNFIGDSAGDSSTSNTNSAITYQSSDIRDQNPLLGALQNNGGPTPTHALQPGSPAINAGDNAKAVDPFNNSPLTTDQRIIAARIAGAAVDIGAFEVQAATAATVSISGHVTNSSGRGISGVNLSLTDSGGNVRTATTTSFGYYQFTDVQIGETYILAASGKHFTFNQPVQVLNVNEEINQVNFIANAEKRVRIF
jgi:CSLREA domain-containing protein